LKHQSGNQDKQIKGRREGERENLSWLFIHVKLREVESPIQDGYSEAQAKNLSCLVLTLDTIIPWNFFSFLKVRTITNFGLEKKMLD
jgi:hypothetical protein